MRTADNRMSPHPVIARQNILICLGFGLVLILNATSAEATGISAMGLALAKPFAVLSGRTRSAQSPLSISDARHYRLAFSAVAAGHWDDAEVEAGRVSDKLLQGEVLAARYLSPDYKPQYDELSAWLMRYAELPQATSIYRLAQALRPDGAMLQPPLSRQPGMNAGVSAPRLPGVDRLSRIRLTGTYSGDDARRVNCFVTALSSHLRDDAAVTARRLLDTSPAVTLLEPQDLSTVQAHVAMGLLYDGETGAALRLAGDSLANQPSGEALWTAGLAAYRLERFNEARDHFAAMAALSDAEPWTDSAASFWAARACLKLGWGAEARSWFSRAASHGGTFYGMLAERVDGQAIAAEPPIRLSHAAVGSIAAVPAGRRALALAEIGQTERAQAELGEIDSTDNPALRNSLRLYALQLQLPDLAQRIRIGLTGGDGMASGTGSYPVPRLQPKGGYTTDPALIFAIMRQESRFDPHAESDAGAVGLMQLMPQTAAAISHGSPNAQKENWRLRLRDPQVNVELGQRYVQTLLSSSHVSGNLLMMAAAYNSGPGTLTRWRGDRVETDPLMFVETLPAAETRGFVEQVMTNYWVYQLQMHASTASLSDLAQGKWPVYQPLPPKLMLVADRN